MNTKFDPNSSIIRHCIIGMGLEENGKMDEARSEFYQAWHEASDDYDKFIAAYYVARQQMSSEDQLKWLQTSLQCALNINDENVKSAYSTLYANIARCYEALFDSDHVRINYELSEFNKGKPSDKGPFYHGTKAALNIGDLLIAGGLSNYKSELQMNHIYFTANINGAGLAAALAKGEGKEHIYLVSQQVS